MPIWILSVVLALNLANGLLTYHPDSKRSGLIWLGLATSVLANALWIWLAKNTPESTRLMLYALSWDFIATTVYVGVPVLLFGARLPALGWMGVGMAVVGLSIVRFAMR